MKIINYSLIWFLKLLKKVPLVGRLASCSAYDHGYALLELASTTFFSFTPLLVAYLVTYLDNNETRFWPCIMNNIQNGELFIYSASFLAPVFFVIMRKRTDPNAFPSKAIHTFLYFILWCVVVLIFGLKRAGFHFDPLSLDTAQKYVFAFTLVLFYLVLVFNNSLLPNPSETMREEEAEFTADVAAHRG